MKKYTKFVLSIILVFAICFQVDIRNVMAKETVANSNNTIEVVEKEMQKESSKSTKEDLEKTTKGEERAEELSKMPLSGKSPIAYVGLIAVSVLVLGVMISVGKSTKKKDTFV